MFITSSSSSSIVDGGPLSPESSSASIITQPAGIGIIVGAIAIVGAVIVYWFIRSKRTRVQRKRAIVVGVELEHDHGLQMNPLVREFANPTDYQKRKETIDGSTAVEVKVDEPPPVMRRPVKAAAVELAVKTHEPEPEEAPLVADLEDVVIDEAPAAAVDEAAEAAGDGEEEELNPGDGAEGEAAEEGDFANEYSDEFADQHDEDEDDDVAHEHRDEEHEHERQYSESD